MSLRNEKYRVGEVRPSQLLHTFGIGAIIDLPHLSVMVMGLDDWSPAYATEIGEERLLLAVQEQLGPQVKSLRVPPIQPEGSDNPFDGSAQIGVPVATFPRWMLCPHCRLLAPRDSDLFQLKSDNFRPDRTRYVHANCTKRGAPPTVLPARFLVACEKGHLDDFPWHYFVHQGASACTGAIRLLEFGVSGEATDIMVTCDACGALRRMSEAFGEEGKQAMPACRGRNPHLRDFAEHGCDQQMKAILLGASNSWFGLTLTALSVPTAVDTLGQLIEANWLVLEKVTSKEVLQAFRAIGQLQAFLTVGDDALWDAIVRKRSGGGGETAEARSLKAPEWQVFTKPAGAPRLPDFQVTEVPPPSDYRQLLRRVVLVEKLREVSACLGFTRITSPGDFHESAELPEDHRVSLSRHAPLWVPAAEVRGEGLFLQFDELAIQAWHAQPDVLAFEQDVFKAHVHWRRVRRLPDPRAGFPGVRYMLLHSFAHALMRQVALECGYTVASIRERIYALAPTDEDGPMAGVLLYTAAPDSEGTLGGLVSLGAPHILGRHIAGALDAMRLCASDPLCAEHTPLTEPQTLHGAACHACLFAPETSCERGNKYLDRSLLVPTVDREGLNFFGGV
ncbi:DUF1998 domain-containing protein [Candidatus Chloroploca sp. Khr17]|uniref:DUF1998 domain-containing protein n=1 Tax=Candidatus Chloroploca sp. Khr17 TaxID=2496869 RepID=UPI00101CCA1D|nr:DUF1998 domain-containing protein [Candidatus Chloroploca sp. Khr17]